MSETKSTKLANIDFKLEWKSPVAEHTDVYHVENIDVCKDRFPPKFADKIVLLKVGESYSETFPAKDVIGEGYTSSKVISFDAEYFNINFKDKHSPPMLYRFYPSAIAWQGLDANHTDYTPFRLITINNDSMVADKNHPLAKYYLTLTASKVSESDVSLPNDWPRRDLGKLLTSSGPGMQTPFEYGDPVFFKHYPFQLLKHNTEQETEDQAHLAQHPRSAACEQIANLYTQLLPKHSKVLDLMSNQHSYLEDGYNVGLLVGLGVKEEELSTNQRLDTYQIQDLNSNTTLPFETNSFDDAICSFSIEQLTDPLAIMQEIARVVKAGGKFIITFSNNRPSSNAITLWEQLHPFERMQLVLEYFRNTGLFDELNTFSKRGLSSAKGEKFKNKERVSNAIYAVWGSVK